MLTTTRWNPFEALATLHRDMDRIFERQWGENRPLDRTWMPSAEMSFDQDAWKVRVALPGIDPKQVRIDLQGNTLRVAGDRPAPGTPDHNDAFQTEFVYGPFERTFTLPTAVDRDNAKASYRYGVLEVALPVAQSEKPHRIDLTGGTVEDIEVRKLA